MKVLTAIVATLFLVAAHAGSSNCHDLCSGGAITCQTKSEAASCATGYGLSSNNKCIACGTNPTKGTGDIGMAAGKGKWWQPWNSGTCKTCVANCGTCNDATNCKTCASGFWPVNAVSKTCTSCGSNCVLCASATQCQTCKAGFYPKAGVCTACTANCNTCNGAGPKCDNVGCKPKYQKSADGTCVSCDSTKPGTHFTATKAGSCADPCEANCKTCASATTCNTCANGSTSKKTLGYWVSAGKCKACTANCAGCVGSASCTSTATCFDGYQKDAKGECKACPTVGAFFTTATGACANPCTANCKTCNAVAGCGVCADGWTVNANTCHKCAVAGAKTCTFADKAVKATACLTSYYGTPAGAGPYTKCTQCDPKCTAGLCTSTTQCAVGGCATGYKRGQNGKCVACKTTPALDVTTVWVAEEGLTCVSCYTGCAGSGFCGVDANKKAECQKCNTNYWPVDSKGASAGGLQTTKPPAGGSCKLCSGNNCATCKSINQCQTCKNGYRVDAKFACEACSDGNCNTCNAAAATCTACKTGYSVTGKNGCKKCNTAGVGVTGVFWNAAGDGTCAEPCTAGCATCKDATKCTTCQKFPGGTKVGYKLSGTNTCESCPANCGKCDADKTKCDAAGCFAGYQRDNKGVCHQCSGAGKFFTAADATPCATCKSNCLTCATKTTCNQCQPGFYKDGKGDCLACGVKNCATCTAGTHATLCTTCKGKYAISADKKSCANQCDAHALSCTNANNAASCDNAKKYFLSNNNRCVYCNVDLVKQTAVTNKGNQFWDKTNSRCYTCDPNADGCKSGIEVIACKKGYVKNGKLCTAECASGQTAVATFAKGKCHTCDSQSKKGQCVTAFETGQCNKGYHVQTAGVGKCCGDDSSAPAMFSGVAALAGLVAAASVLLH